MYVCVRRARAHTHTLSGQMDCDETMQWSNPAATNARARECPGTTCIEAEKIVFLQRSRSSSGSLDRDAGLRCPGKQQNSSPHTHNFRRLRSEPSARRLTAQIFRCPWFPE